MTTSKKAMTETVAILKIKTTIIYEIKIFVKLIKIMIIFVIKIFEFSEN